MLRAGKVQARPATDRKARPPAQTGPGQVYTSTFTHTYDPLYRLERADYSDAAFFAYVYDAVDNRLMQTMAFGTTTYASDFAMCCYTFASSGLGDRVRQKIKDTPTHYMLDRNPSAGSG